MLTLVYGKDFNVEYYRIQQQSYKGIPRLNRGPINQVMEFRRAVLGPILKAIGFTVKWNMKMGQNFDRRLQERFECRILENLTTNS